MTGRTRQAMRSRLAPRMRPVGEDYHRMIEKLAQQQNLRQQQQQVPAHP